MNDYYKPFKFFLQHSKLLAWAYVEAINKDYDKARLLVDVAFRLKRRHNKKGL